MSTQTHVRGAVKWVSDRYHECVASPAIKDANPRLHTYRYAASYISRLIQDTEWHTDIRACTHAHIHAGTHETHTQAHIETHTQTHTQTHMQTLTQTHRRSLRPVIPVAYPLVRDCLHFDGSMSLRLHFPPLSHPSIHPSRHSRAPIHPPRSCTHASVKTITSSEATQSCGGTNTNAHIVSEKATCWVPVGEKAGYR
eukprot:GHVU01023066.1.p1 GENE.GHVU01023066.1~~GHVU01023066.1.p1  ORF type:complete len:197 (-),score=3.59 GHVU01023066.1:45-635(-)